MIDRSARIALTLEALVLDKFFLPVNDPQDTFGIPFDDISCFEPSVWGECFAVRVRVPKIPSSSDSLAKRESDKVLHALGHVRSMEPKLPNFT